MFLFFCRIEPSLVEAGGSIYYTGDYPQGALENLRNAVANADFSGIAGLTSVNGVTVKDKDGNMFGPPTSFSSSPTKAPVDGVNSVRGDEGNRSPSRLKAGGYIGIAVAVAVVGMVGLFALYQHSKMVSERDASFVKHQEFIDEEDIEVDGTQGEPPLKAREMNISLNQSTDDESDGYGSSPDRGERQPTQPEVDPDTYRIASVVDEASLWTEEDSRKVRGTLNSAEAMVEAGEIDMEEALANHSCSSPNCVLCAAKAERAITFVKTELPSGPGCIPADSRREYSAADTVDL